MGAFAIPYRVLSQMIELATLKGENYFKPYAQNRILLHFRVLFKINDKHSSPLYMGVSSGITLCVIETLFIFHRNFFPSLTWTIVEP